MAGNVREWCWNETENGRMVRGGSWSDPIYMFGNVSQAPPLDRSPQNGFRCALYRDRKNIPEAVFAAKRLGHSRDYYREKPVPEAIFRVYKEQFSYDKTALNAHRELRKDDAADWMRETVTYDAPYGNERISAHLFLPKSTVPPYQTIVYVPGSGALSYGSSDDIETYFEFPVFLSFIVKNGRAVLFPVYKGTFERREDFLTLIHEGAASRRYRDFLIQVVKDFRRSIDFLETRPDIDQQRLG